MEKGKIIIKRFNTRFNGDSYANLKELESKILRAGLNINLNDIIQGSVNLANANFDEKNSISFFSKDRNN